MSKITDLINSPEWAELGRLHLEAKELREKEYNEYWESLSYEDQLKSFYSVVKRIHKGDIIDRGTYRYVLYDVFGFDMDAYALGMECGYMYLHNALFEAEESNN